MYHIGYPRTKAGARYRSAKAPIQAVERIMWVPLALRLTPEQSRSRWRFFAAD